MKFKILKEGEPLVIKEATDVLDRPLHDPNNIWENNCNSKTRIYTEIYTDGEIDNDVKIEGKQTKEQCYDYYFDNGNKYNQSIDTLLSKEVYFKNYSYIITYLISVEWETEGEYKNYIVHKEKERTIYIKDPSDRKALYEARKILRLRDEPVVFWYNEKYNQQEISKNVYHLVKKK
jgi:hypothetical protein